MNKFIIALLLVVCSAASASQKKWEEEDPCFEIYSLASSVMTARQQGAPMPKVMKLIRDSGDELAEEMAKDAFSEPKFSTKLAQHDAISEFANKWYMRCLRVKSERE